METNMKIGIVVYSQTGNTLSVSESLRERLACAGHEAALERLTPEGNAAKNSRDIRFESLPDLSGYEALVLAAPVQAFSLCPAMAAYLPQMPELAGKKTACFVTKGFASAWTGGNKAIATMEKAVVEKGGEVCGTGIVGWMSREREKEIGELVEKMARAFE
jgi:NAD(P)H dehydrogenase (quinone)